MTDDLAPLLAEIDAHPDSTEPLLVLADWYEKSGIEPCCSSVSGGWVRSG